MEKIIMHYIVMYEMPEWMRCWSHYWILYSTALRPVRFLMPSGLVSQNNARFVSQKCLLPKKRFTFESFARKE